MPDRGVQQLETENGGLKTVSEKEHLSNRLVEFAAEIIGLAVRLDKTPVGRHIGLQISRSATSAGANYEEACGAQSRADFVHKLQIVLKELRESLYWLRLIQKANLVAITDNYHMLASEGNELARIIGKSVVTAKQNK